MTKTKTSVAERTPEVQKKGQPKSETAEIEVELTEDQLKEVAGGDDWEASV